MKLLVDEQGRFSWATTRSVVTTSLKFSDGTNDFGAGSEIYSTCAGCGRKLPMCCMHLDHILPFASYGHKFISECALSFYSLNVPHNKIDSMTGVVQGGIGYIQEKIISHSTFGRETSSIRQLNTISSENAWYNDLENLQFMCMSCNTRKQDSPFSTVFPGRFTIPISNKL